MARTHCNPNASACQHNCRRFLDASSRNGYGNRWASACERGPVAHLVCAYGTARWTYTPELTHRLKSGDRLPAAIRPPELVPNSCGYATRPATANWNLTWFRLEALEAEAARRACAWIRGKGVSRRLAS
ncbi:MAG: hypothetical protein OXU20_01335 [Myxococcales bacterium]|nr:hypothetical protein [Myxococcales bacterium]